MVDAGAESHRTASASSRDFGRAKFHVRAYCELLRKQAPLSRGFLVYEEATVRVFRRSFGARRVAVEGWPWL